MNKKGQIRSNPHVFTETMDKGNGYSMINHRAFIDIDTVNKIMKAANKAENVQYKTRDYDEIDPRVRLLVIQIWMEVMVVILCSIKMS